ncbi:right-handed parallel beta-helix repeat-containing protein [Malonomonas rubra]|uniref:right-handed parallel beta-helix repeat-containing protein n=1 Tax=Malonomonas rubra TaxID=57040 RepID=UPI0026EE1D07|nr:right-handed parallel beta-helix repeat-containing protein [Malonomonas rubra]
MMRWFIFVFMFIALSACAQSRKISRQSYSDLVIAEDTLWSGSILIDGQVEVLHNAKLTIAPGTDIAFSYRDENRDGLGDGTLIVKGELVAVGSKQQPIRFRSAKENPQPGDWLEIAVDFSKEVHLRYCEIRDSAYTLHAHFTNGLVEDCHIHHNIDGCRIGQATMVLQHNLVEHNTGKGINFRNSRVKVLNNLIRNNTAGIFLFENDQPFEISANNILDNQYQLRLGDFYVADVDLHGNWWGTADEVAIRKGIYDRQVDPEIGVVTIDPSPTPVNNAGPR